MTLKQLNLEAVVQRDAIATIWRSLSIAFEPPLEETVDSFDTLIDKVAMHGKTLAYKKDGLVLGAVSFYANDLESKSAFVTLLATDESARGEGLGHALLSAAIQESQKFGMSRMRLDVRTENDRAKRFYESHGFIVVDRNSAFFTMSLDFNGSFPYLESRGVR